MIRELFGRIADKRQKQADAKVETIRQLIVALAEQELDTPGAPKIDVEKVATLLETEGLTEAELAENVAMYKRRSELAKLANEQQKLHDAANLAENELRQAVEAEAERRRAADRERERLASEATLLTARHQAAVEADAFLSETAAHLQYDPALDAELASVNETIKEGEWRVRANGKPGRWDMTLGDLRSEPALLVEQTKCEIERGAGSPERIAELRRQLAAAERAVVEAQRELLKLRQQREKIVAKMTPGKNDHLKPENFRLIRHERKPAMTASEASW